MIELGFGVFIETSEEMKEQQLQWDENDPCKCMNFDEYPYWITTDSGNNPEGFLSIEEIKKFLEK